jgi:hypothetical protein
VVFVGEKKFLDQGCFGGVDRAAKRNREILLACQNVLLYTKDYFILKLHCNVICSIFFIYLYLYLCGFKKSYLLYTVISNFTIFWRAMCLFSLSRVSSARNNI